jgi:hypothetical protein
MMANRFDQLIASWEPVLGKAFSDSVYALRDQAQIDHIVRMLDNGDVEGAIRAVGLDPVAFRAFDKAITNAFEAGGVYTAGKIPVRRLADGFRVRVQFNIRNPAAERWLSERSSTQVTAILDDQRIMIREFLLAGMKAGNNPRTTALDLVGRIGASGKREGGVIGLTSSQAEWVRNYSDALKSDKPRDALTYSLRDARFDRAVIKAAESGEPIPASLLDKMEAAYTNRALRYRAEQIALNESMTALHEAQQQAMEQAVESGAISSDTVTGIWHNAGDNRVRDSHDTMGGQVVALGEMFTTGAGNVIEYPHDPNAPLDETAGCRCWREFRVDFLAGIK